MFRQVVIALSLSTLVACGGGGDALTASDDSLSAVLAGNETWPYETDGVLDIVEAGFDGTSDAPQWAVGMLLANGDEFGPLIEIDGAVIARAGINIDSGEPVRAWLEAPKDVSGEMMYPVSKLQKL